MELFLPLLFGAMWGFYIGLTKDTLAVTVDSLMGTGTYYVRRLPLQVDEFGLDDTLLVTGCPFMNEQCSARPGG